MIANRSGVEYTRSFNDRMSERACHHDHHEGQRMSDLASGNYAAFLIDLKARIRQAQVRALRAANAELLRLYWEIGESIHLKQKSLGWGKSVDETLARDLQMEFPGEPADRRCD